MIRGWIGIIAVIILAVVSTVLIITSKQIVLQQQPQNQLSVTGNTEFYVDPDKAEIYVKIVTLNLSATVAKDENTQVTNKVTAALLSAGVSQNDIETSSYTLQRREEYNPMTQQQEFKGYELDNVLKVTTLKLDSVGNLVDTAVNNGANGIEQVVFDLSDLKQKQENAIALGNAAKDASEKASTLATSLNVPLGNIISVSESNYLQQPYYAKSMDLVAASAPAATVISPGKVDITATVNVIYALKYS